MILCLKWTGFELTYREGTLELRWSTTAVLDANAARCAAASLRLRPDDGSGQLAFRFRSEGPGATDLIAVRIDVPAAHVRDAEQLIERLRREHNIPDRERDKETLQLDRIPVEADDWLLAPTSPVSEQLFDEVMNRIASD